MEESKVEKNDSMGLSGAKAPGGPVTRERNAIGSWSSTSLAPVKVLIADRSEQFRWRIREMFADEREFSVVGEIALPYDLIAACVNLSPHIVVLGLGAHHDGPDALSAIAALKRIIHAVTLVGVIVLVSSDTAEDSVQSLRAGARGVLLRDLSKRTLLDAVGDVMAGGAALDRRLTGMIFDCLAEGAVSGSRDAQRPMDPAVLRALSPREQEVLRSLAQGLRNKEIAAQLGVSVGTVKTHLRHIFHKLEVSDRVSAVLKAFQLYKQSDLVQTQMTDDSFQTLREVA